MTPDEAFEAWWASCDGSEDGDNESVDLANAARAAWTAATERAAKELERRAELYQLPDGDPGPLGFNCWGWRDIAKHLRDAATRIRGGTP